jgi:hypothetical protein
MALTLDQADALWRLLTIWTTPEDLTLSIQLQTEADPLDRQLLADGLRALAMAAGIGHDRAAREARLLVYHGLMSCAECGDPFEPSPKQRARAAAGKPTFCSRRCKGLHHKKQHEKGA